MLLGFGHGNSRPLFFDTVNLFACQQDLPVIDR